MVVVSFECRRKRKSLENVASEPLSRFIERRPTVKILALSFILLIGTLLVADAFHFHVPRGYVYFAISYAVFVEILNTMIHARKDKNIAG